MLCAGNAAAAADDDDVMAVDDSDGVVPNPDDGAGVWPKAVLELGICPNADGFVVAAAAPPKPDVEPKVDVLPNVGWPLVEAAPRLKVVPKAGCPADAPKLDVDPKVAGC